MSFGSFLRGIAAQVNPWDGGETFSTYNQKKKRDDQPQIVRPTPNPGIQTAGFTNTIKNSQSPVDFGTLNSTVNVPQRKDYLTTVSAPKNYDTTVNSPSQPTISVKNAQPKQNIILPDGTNMKNVSNAPDYQAPPQPSFWHRATHNLATDAVGSLAKLPVQFSEDWSNTFANLGNRLAGGKNQTIQQNIGTDPINQAAIRWSGATGKNTQLAGDAAQIALTALAPGASKVLETGALKVLPKAAPSVVRTVVPKLFAGSQLGGGFNVAASVSDNDLKPSDLAKSYGLGALVGGATEGSFPLVKGFLPRVLRRNSNVVNDVESETPIVSDAVAGSQAPTKIPVSQVADIPIQTGDVGTVMVPVRRNPKKLIQEAGGDAPTAQLAAQKLADDKAKRLADIFDSQGTPDRLIRDVKAPKPTEYVTVADIQAERKALDDALANKEITKAQHKAANKALDDTPTIDGKPANSKQITVKEVKGIDANPPLDVPADMPAAPGTVRLTKTTNPVKAKSEAIAAQTPPATPTVSPEVQAILENPKQFSARQVAAARRQLKLAKQYQKAQQGIKDVIANTPELAPKPQGNPGFVSTGEYRRGVNGNVSEVAHAETEGAQAAFDMANTSYKDVLKKVSEEKADNGVISPDSTRKLKYLRDSGKFAKTSPEYKAINEAYFNGLSDAARTMSLADKTARASDSGDELSNRFINKLILFADDSSKLTDSQVTRVRQAENEFTNARDTAFALGENFKSSGSTEDFAAWKRAQQMAEMADRRARTTEYLVAKEVLHKNKDITAVKALQNIEKKAGVYSMDAIDANMLSGTGTMVRNYVNTTLPRLENRAFGRLSSLAVRPLGNVGGSSVRGARIGSQIGKDMFSADRAARKEAGIGFIRRTATAGNTLGEHNIQATAYAKAYDHYKQLLKKEGYSGDELANRAEFMARTEDMSPNSLNLVQKYEADALQANALSSLVHSKKIENILADGIQRKMAEMGFGSTGQQIGRFGAKGVTRVGLGFPTVIARSLWEGAKRATLGVPEILTAATKYTLTHDKEAFAQDLAKAIQHMGSGAAMIAAGYGLAKAGLVSGAYPSDKNERDRWEQTGRQAHSVNINGQWFDIPGYLGGFALPFMLGASMADGNVQDEASLKNAWQTVLDASPVDNIKSTLDIFTGEASDSKVKNAITSLVRAATPAGSFVNEAAKMTDSTKNDTTTGSTISNLGHNIASGIPVVNNLVNDVPKTDSQGNVLHNPNAVATFFGANGSTQQAGVEDVQQAQNQANEIYNSLKQYGVLDNQNLMGLVDPKLRAQIGRGEDLTPEQVTSIQKSVSKGIGNGVSAASDNNWRQRGDYATSRSATQTKLQLLEADPTAKPSDIANLKTQIARDTVLEENQIPYDDLQLYENTSVSEWRKLYETNPETYQKLYNIDSLLTKAGGSYRSGDSTQPKYYLGKSGGGGGSGGRKMDTSFGTLDLSGSSFAPKVRQYETASFGATNDIPVIRRTQPNIVHKIGRG